MAGSRYPSVRKMCTSVFSSAVQNNPIVQEAALEAQALDALMELVQVETDKELKEKYVGCLSALIRGEYIHARKSFVDKAGLQLLQRLIQQDSSLRTLKKVSLLLSDMFYQCKLHHEKQTIDLATQIGIDRDLINLISKNDNELTDMVGWALNCLQEATETQENTSTSQNYQLGLA